MASVTSPIDPDVSPDISRTQSYNLRTLSHRGHNRKHWPRDDATVCVREISYPRVPEALNGSISHRPAEKDRRGGEKCGLVTGAKLEILRILWHNNTVMSACGISF